MNIVLANFFKSIWDTINGWFDGLFGLDKLIDGVITWFWSMAPIIRLLLLIFIAIIIILGVISFVKKILKLFIAFVVIVVIYIIFKK